MQKAVYFDESAVLELMNGNKNVLKVLEDASDFYTGQLARLLLEGAEEYMILKKFFKDRPVKNLLSSFKILDVDGETGAKAAEVVGKLKTDGVDVSVTGAVTLAHTALTGATLITKDRELVKKAKRIGLNGKSI